MGRTEGTCLLSFMVGIPQHSVKREGGREERRKQLSLSAQFYGRDSAAQNKERKGGSEGGKEETTLTVCSVLWWGFCSTE